MWDAACEYFSYITDNPLQEQQIIKYKDDYEKVTLDKVRPFTLMGLCLFLGVNAQYFTDAINNYTGIGANAANTMGNINANKQLGIGKAISTGIGGLTGALSSYQAQPQYDQQYTQPQQYGFAGLRQQPTQINFNQGQPKNGFWS